MLDAGFRVGDQPGLRAQDRRRAQAGGAPDQIVARLHEAVADAPRDDIAIVAIACSRHKAPAQAATV